MGIKKKLWTNSPFFAVLPRGFRGFTSRFSRFSRSKGFVLSDCWALAYMLLKNNDQSL